MEDFIKQWGPAIITVIAFMVLIGIVYVFKDPIGNAFKSLFDTFTESVPTSVPTPSITP